MEDNKNGKIQKTWQNIMTKEKNQPQEEEILKNEEAVAEETAQTEEIAKTKMADLNAADLEAAKRMIAGTARSMGVVVEG